MPLPSTDSPSKIGLLLKSRSVATGRGRKWDYVGASENGQERREREKLRTFRLNLKENLPIAAIERSDTDSPSDEDDL